jgi:ubiquinol-cytochrome c reductase iron-sulfur subunit
MAPSADVLALSSAEFKIDEIALGSTITVKWRGKPVFIKHRTPEEIATESAVPMSQLIDPQTDAERVQDPEW